MFIEVSAVDPILTQVVSGTYADTQLALLETRLDRLGSAGWLQPKPLGLEPKEVTPAM